VLAIARGLVADAAAQTPDSHAADAFVALCTAILHAEGACCAAIDRAPLLKESEGAIWEPG
jgi:hypothetical protein